MYKWRSKVVNLLYTAVTCADQRRGYRQHVIFDGCSLVAIPLKLCVHKVLMFSLGAWSLSGNECTKNGVIKFVSSLHHTNREKEEEESDLSLFILPDTIKDCGLADRHDWLWERRAQPPPPPCFVINETAFDQKAQMSTKFTYLMVFMLWSTLVTYSF